MWSKMDYDGAKWRPVQIHIYLNRYNIVIIDKILVVYILIDILQIWL